MKNTLLLALAATLSTLAAPAQISGMINRGAPTVTNAIAMGDNKLEMSYTSIRFGEGEWREILAKTERHQEFNAFAEKTPIGKVKTTCDLNAAGRQVPAGEYAMFFTAHERAGWVLNLKPAEGEAVRWRLALKDTDQKHDCMCIRLEPSAKADTCSLTIAFGNQAVTVPVSVAQTAEK